MTKFYLDMRGKSKDGKGSILIMIFHNHTTAYISTGIRVSPNNWVKDKIFGTPDAEILNAFLLEKKADVGKKISVLSLESQLETRTASEIKRIITPSKTKLQTPKYRTVVSLFREYMDNGNLSDGSKVLYELTLKKIVSFGGENITIDDINYKWMREFDAFLSKFQSTNGKAIYLRQFRAVCNYARHIGATTNYPFENFKIKQEETRKRSIPIELFRKFYTYPTSETNSYYRDYFFLSFFLIGINTKDLLLAKKSQIVDGRLEYSRSKTKKKYSIKIEPEAAGDSDTRSAMGNVDDLIDSFDIIEAVQSYNDTDDAITHIAKTLLSKVTPGTPEEKALRQLFEEKLGDIAKASGLGVVPKNPYGSGSGTHSKGYEKAVKDIEGIENNLASLKPEEATAQVDKIQQDINSKVYDSLTDEEVKDLNSKLQLLRDRISAVPTESASHKTLVRKIGEAQSSDNMLLKQILAGDFSSYPDLTDSEKFDLISKATAKMNALLIAEGKIVGGSETQDPGSDEDAERSKARHDFYVERNMHAINGTPPTVSFYDYTRAGKGIKARREANRKQPRIQAKLDWMNAHHVQQFVDSGALAALDKAYRSKGKRLPIYFLGNPHVTRNGPHNVQSNQAENPYASLTAQGNPQVDVLFAIEMNADDREVLKRFEDAGIFSNSTLVTVGEGENAVQYQVIGESFYPDLGYVDKREGKEKAMLLRAREEHQRVWNHAVKDSILPQYNEDIANDRTGNYPKEGHWFVAKQAGKAAKAEGVEGERLSTTLNYIGTGRIESTRTDVDDSTASCPKISLADALKSYRAQKKPFKFHIINNSNDSKVPSELRTSYNAPLGSLWIETENADGSKAYTYVTIARTDEVDWENLKDTPVGKSIYDSLSKVFAETLPRDADEVARKKDFENRKTGLDTLNGIIHLGRGVTFSIDFENGTPRLWIGNKTCSSVEDAINILKSKNSSYRFQVSTDQASNQKAMDSLMASGILLTDVKSFDRFEASFGVDFLEDKDSQGNDIAPRAVISESSVSSEFYSGSTPTSRSVQSLTGKRTIPIGKTTYTMTKAGKVFDNKGREVEDPVVVASVKAIDEVVALKQAIKLKITEKGLKFLDEDFLPLEKQIFGEYKGKRWLLHTTQANGRNIDHVNLFERTINGVTVHLRMDAKAGVVSLVYSDSVWRKLVDAAESASITMGTTTDVTTDPIQAALQAQRTGITTTTTGGQQIETGPFGKIFRQFKGKASSQKADSGWSNGLNIGGRGSGRSRKSDSSQTTQEKNKEDQDDASNFDCGNKSF